MKRLLERFMAQPAPARQTPREEEGAITCPTCHGECKLVECKPCEAKGHIPYRTERAQRVQAVIEDMFSKTNYLDRVLRVFINSRPKAHAALKELFESTEYALQDGSRIKFTVTLLPARAPNGTPAQSYSGNGAHPDPAPPEPEEASA